MLLCSTNITPDQKVPLRTLNVLLRTTIQYSKGATPGYYSSATVYYQALRCTTKFYSNSTVQYGVVPEGSAGAVLCCMGWY